MLHTIKIVFDLWSLTEEIAAQKLLQIHKNHESIFQNDMDTATDTFLNEA